MYISRRSPSPSPSSGPHSTSSLKSLFPVNSVGNTTFWVVLAENFRQQQNIQKGSPVFPDGMLRTEIRLSFFQSRPSLLQVSGLRGRFSVNGTDFTNGKRDSGTKFTSPEFSLPFIQSVNRPGCPFKW